MITIKNGGVLGYVVNPSRPVARKWRRVVVWFSCGAASAVAAKLTTEKYPEAIVVYCDTSTDEHPDNQRFFDAVSQWIARPILKLKNSQFDSVEQVWDARKYMSGIAGAPCTVVMKKLPRFDFQQPYDLNVFGFTADEEKRIDHFESNNPDMLNEWILRDQGVTKQDCYKILTKARIALPVMYSLGFKNNNCIGCVKASSPKYWNLVREHFPEIYARRVEQSRRIGARLTRIKINGKWTRVYLDELPSSDFSGGDENVSCGPECAPPQLGLGI